MRQRKGISRTSQPSAARLWRRALSGAVVVVAFLMLWLFGRGILALGSRQMAARQMSRWAISEAQRWLAWSAWLEPHNGTTDLMQAACFRHLEQVDRWQEALQSAARKKAAASSVQREIELGLLQSGQAHDGTENPLGALVEAGASPHDLAAAFVHGYLRRGESETAAKALAAWAADYPEEPHVAYMEGVCRWRLGESERAQMELEKALSTQPGHELARTALAGLFEQQDRLDEALQQYFEGATRSPTSEAAIVGIARVLRKLGRLNEARAVLQPLTSCPELPPPVAAEMGHIELNSGNYREAERWFAQADLDPSRGTETLSAAASTFALNGKNARAERLLDRVDAERNRSTMIYDLRVRLAIDAHDTEAAHELRRLSSSAPVNADIGGTGAGGEDLSKGSMAFTSEIYVLQCGPCHGESGDGNGRATRHLFPRPRDLRAGKSRLVSALNGVPTLEDVEAVIRLGMPGTSMPSFDNLSEDQRKLLAREVLRLNREGVREQFINAMRDEEEEIDEEEVNQVVETCTTPGEIVRLPRIGPADPATIARGKDAYSRLGCQNCHGDDGKGVWDTPLFDDKGCPSPPRDLVREPFKGGHEPESIYLRICVGMPGTPHPACYNLSEDQLVAVVGYCRSLSQEPKRVLTNHERATRAYATSTGGSPAP